MPDQLDGLEANVYFEVEGDEIVGTIESVTLDAGKYRIGLRTRNGALRWVTAYQAHLQAQLANWAPLLEGETLWIRYVGDQARAPRGMTPSKLFKVKVDRTESPAPAPKGPISGEVVAPKKAPAPGVDR